MHYRTLVLHLDESPACEVRTQLAARLADDAHAHLVGVSPTGWLDVAWQLGPDLLRATPYREVSIDVLRSRAHDVVAAFERRAAQVPGLSWEAQQPQGDVVHEMVAAGRCADLVIVGQSARHTPLVPPELPQQLLLRCGRPLLLVPRDATTSSVGHRVLVAWKDCRESTRAIADALPLLARADEVELVCVEPPDAAAASVAALERTRRWLARHHVATQAPVVADAAGADVGELLIARAVARRADLIVAGGYGHSRLAEAALGGVTRTLLEHSTVPVLLSH